MKSNVFKHCKNCHECALQNQANTAADFKHFKVPEIPMQLICMDLVGPISPVSSKGNRFILTCIDMLTGFTVAVPIKDKTASTVCDTYRNHIYCTFGGSARILTDNGTEFKNEEMNALCEQLNIKRVYSPVYTPEANGKLESWPRFFKACVAKHIRGNQVEWDEVVPPCQTSGESPFVLMFGRDPITPFAKLLEPAPRYWGDRGGHLKMDLLRKLYLLTAENVKRAREGRDPAENTNHKDNFKVNDLVLVRDVTAGAFAPRYSPNYRIVEIHGPNRIVVRDEKGNETVRRASHLKACKAKAKVAAMTPDRNEYDSFGRSTKLLLHPRDIPDLQFSSETEDKGEIPLETEVSVVQVVQIANKQEEGGESCEYFVEPTDNQGKYGEIPPEAVEGKGKDRWCEKQVWFQKPVKYVSRWSQALKTGVMYSMGLDKEQAAPVDSVESDQLSFSFFL